ncbi:MAG: glycosyltransferase family 2 protein [Acidobacteriota bacterium]
MSRVSVVIPSWNGRHLLPFCLAAIGRQDEPDLEVIVVDNGSTDDTAPWLARAHPQVRVIALPVNRGFAAGTNRGIAASERQYILTLNNDAAPDPTYVRVLADHLDTHPTVACCQGRIRQHREPTRIDSLGIRFDAALRAHQIGHGEVDRPDERTARPVDGVSACAALFRRCALDEVSVTGGPFDPTFFAYYEDADLALRLARAGWAASLVPAATCTHLGSATGIEGSSRKTFLLGRNYVLYLARHVGPAGLVTLAPRLAAIRLRRLLSMLRHPRRDLVLSAGELGALPHLWRLLRRTGRPARHDPGRLPRDRPRSRQA